MFQEKVIADSFKIFVSFYFDNHYQVTGSVPRVFISLAVDHYLVFVWKAYSYWNFNILVHSLDTFTFAHFAKGALFNHFSSSLTILAMRLCLCVHSGTQLNHLDDLSLSFALSAFIYFRSSFSTTIITYFEPFYVYFEHGSMLSLM